MKLSIIIPCFNEEATIHSTVESINAHMLSHQNLSWELILVNDGSSDKTLEVLNVLKTKLDLIKVESFSSNLGRGAAIKKGIATSKGEYIILLDADLSYDVQHIDAIMHHFYKDKNLDVVVVSPYMKGGTVKGVPFFRLILSRLANLILAGFFDSDLSTVTCVVRGYRGDMIRGIPFFESGKELHLEILRKLYLEGAKIKEIPGHLAWKKTKLRAKRKGLKVISSGSKHLVWGLLSRPTRVLSLFTFGMLFLAIYELANIGLVFLRNYEKNEMFWFGVWKALHLTFQHSPHTIVIACVSFIIGFQSLLFWGLFLLLKTQQEETLKHLLFLSKNRMRDKS